MQLGQQTQYIWQIYVAMQLWAHKTTWKNEKYVDLTGSLNWPLMSWKTMIRWSAHREEPQWCPNSKELLMMRQRNGTVIGQQQWKRRKRSLRGWIQIYLESMNQFHSSSLHIIRTNRNLFTFHQCTELQYLDSRKFTDDNSSYRQTKSSVNTKHIGIASLYCVHNIWSTWKSRTVSLRRLWTTNYAPRGIQSEENTLPLLEAFIENLKGEILSLWGAAIKTNSTFSLRSCAWQKLCI